MQKSRHGAWTSFDIVVHASIWEGQYMVTTHLSTRTDSEPFELRHSGSINVHDLAFTGWNELADHLTTALVESSIAMEERAIWAPDLGLFDPEADIPAP